MATKKIDLRKFRHAVSILSREGIINKTDARRAQPNWMRSTGPRGRKDKLSEIVKQYDDVISGKLTPVKLSKDATAKLKRQGFEVVAPKGRKAQVLVPHGADERVIKTGNTFTRIHQSGIESVALPCEYHELPQYLQCLKKNRKLIDAMKRNDEWFGFRFWGNQSAKYRTIEHLIHDLQKYDDITKALKSGRAKDMGEQFAHLEIVKIHRTSAWVGPEGRKSSHGTPEARSRAAKRYRKRVAANPMKAAAQKEKHAEDERRRRANMSDAEKKAYRAKAKKRAKKSRGK